MKIAIDISQIIYGTGVSTYTKQLVSSLIRQYPSDEYLLFGGSLRQQDVLTRFARRNNIQAKIFPLPPTLMSFLWNSLHIVNIEALIGKSDLIHTSDWVEPPSQIPKITTVHDLVPFRYPEYSHPRIVSTHRKRLAWVIKESIKIICVSQSARQDLIDSFGIDGKRTAVVYEGVDSTFQPASPDEITQIKNKYKINSDYIFCLSTIEPRKNIPRLIQAMKTVRKKYPEIKLVIGGRIGWTSPSPFGPGVITTGYLVDTDLPPLFSGCSCYALPSLYEGFSLSHLQAMACGASVVGSRLSSMPEVIGDAGVLIDPFDVKSIATGIIEAIENRQSYSSLGLVRSKMFSWDKTAQQTHAIYQSVLST